MRIATMRAHVEVMYTWKRNGWLHPDTRRRVTGWGVRAQGHVELPRGAPAQRRDGVTYLRPWPVQGIRLPLRAPGACG